MLTYNIIMLTCNKIKSHVNIIISHVNIFMLHVNIIMLHVDINKSHVNIIMLHVDIIYLACRGQKYATIVKPLFFIINRPCLLPEIYVFTLVRKRGIICAFTPILIKPIQGFYKTFKHGMFRVVGSCNFSMLCAHFLLVISL